MYHTLSTEISASRRPSTCRAIGSDGTSSPGVRRDRRSAPAVALEAYRALGEMQGGGLATHNRGFEQFGPAACTPTTLARSRNA